MLECLKQVHCNLTNVYYSLSYIKNSVPHKTIVLQHSRLHNWDLVSHSAFVYVLQQPLRCVFLCQLICFK